jgi:hypothetical protein
MLELSRQNTTARLRATIEEELGAIRQFADLPATELEAMAARIARAIAPYVTTVDEGGPAIRAA